MFESTVCSKGFTSSDLTEQSRVQRREKPLFSVDKSFVNP